MDPKIMSTNKTSQNTFDIKYFCHIGVLFNIFDRVMLSKPQY